MAKHEFGIIDQFEEDRWYCNYEPQKYNCISVDMKVMDIIFDTCLLDLMKINTFACISSQPIHGLEEDGITLIPPTSLQPFSAVIRKANNQIKDPQLFVLIDKIQDAIIKGKYLIHYGI